MIVFLRNKVLFLWLFIYFGQTQLSILDIKTPTDDNGKNFESSRKNKNEF